MIKVLVVEDSRVAREYLVHVLNSDPEIQVIATCSDGTDAVEMVGRIKPDVVTMDINMPRMDGLEATRRIMESNPVPIVIVSGIWEPKEVRTTFKAMEAGALGIVRRPAGIGHPDAEKMTREIILKVKLMSEVKVVKRWSNMRQRTVEPPSTPDAAVPEKAGNARAIAIGASTGGPVVLQTILNGLPRNFPAAILIVQHITSGFLKGMVEWLAQTSGVPLKIAVHRERLLPGHAYFAPDGCNLGVDKDCIIHLDDRETTNGPRPSVGYLFRSLANAFGKEAVGVLLTGMGTDGAQELKLMRDKGAVTIAQDRKTSVIYGMPGAAVELGAALYVLPPERIIGALLTLTGNRGKD